MTANEDAFPPSHHKPSIHRPEDHSKLQPATQSHFLSLPSLAASFSATFISLLNFGIMNPLNMPSRPSSLTALTLILVVAVHLMISPEIQASPAPKHRNIKGAVHADDALKWNTSRKTLDFSMGTFIRYGKCYCKPKGFMKRFNQASAVVKVRVLKITYNWKLTMNKTLKKNLILEYVLRTTAVYKGSTPKKGYTFKAQAFASGDFCGVRLIINKNYVLQLDSLQSISKASHWKRSSYVLMACQAHYDWNALTPWQFSYLNSHV